MTLVSLCETITILNADDHVTPPFRRKFILNENCSLGPGCSQGPQGILEKANSWKIGVNDTFMKGWECRPKKKGKILNSGNVANAIELMTVCFRKCGLSVSVAVFNPIVHVHLKLL